MRDRGEEDYKSLCPSAAYVAKEVESHMSAPIPAVPDTQFTFAHSRNPCFQKDQIPSLKTGANNNLYIHAGRNHSWNNSL